ncbi:MAG: glycosyltransferase [Erysipelotrichaceae bacterium]|jgi:1,2-diacylglycerol-3-alpha-glucose alpha-1,2-glucosyltransferase|nr:glycosyltransferase [Erysipelotrichaceae bacterium]
MKVLLYKEPNISKDSYEGARLNKSIRSALELANIAHTSNQMSEYNLAHLISASEENYLSEASTKDVPVVVSALMCENDPDNAYLDFKYKDGDITNSLLPKAYKFLSKASHILVPCESARAMLVDEGITVPISIVPPGINFSMFDYEKEEEKELFYRYFQEDKSRKFVISIGEYDSLEGINAFIDAGKKCPEATFYFFGHTTSKIAMHRQIKKLNKKSPKNVKFCEMVPIDIYRSALMNASIFMAPCYKKAGFVSLLEAMAAKCQLIVREKAMFPDFLKDGETAYAANFSETLASLTRDYLDGKIRPTVEAAYEMVKKASLSEVGGRLKWIYEQELNNKKA